MKKNHVLLISILQLAAISNLSFAQYNANPHNQPRKRFIDKVEVFAGLNLSFNYGNKFIENYSDAKIQNKRLAKVGYAFGVGVYHPVNNWLDINVRVQWEQKGTKAQLDHPLSYYYIPNTRQLITSEYDYNYTTILVAPRFSLNKKENLYLTVGCYYALIKTVAGLEIYSDPAGGTDVHNKFNGRNWNVVDPDGGIRTWTFIPGLQSFESADYGLTLGLTYKFNLAKQHSLLLQLMDYYGLQEVYNKSDPANLKERNHTISFLLSYSF
jgi:hypothetical protein